MPFTSDVSLLIFCPDDVSIEESGVYKSPITNGLLLICVCNISGILLMKLSTSGIETHYVLDHNTFLVKFSFL